MTRETALEGQGTFTIRYKDVKLRRVVKPKKLRSGSWVEVVSGSGDFLRQASSNLGLDETIILDALDPNEIPRMEHEDEGLYIFARMPTPPQGLSATKPLLIALTPKYVATFSDQPLAGLQRALMQNPLYTTQRTKLVIQLFLELSKAFQESVHHYSKQIRLISTDVTKIKALDINELVKYQMVFDDYLAALEPSDDILEDLLSGKYLRLYEDDKELVEDVLIATKQLIDMCKRRLKRIHSIREGYATIVSNNLNQTMKRLTSLTIILTLPTMIFSFYGMNVRLPYDNHPIMWLGLAFLTLGIMFILARVFRKKDLL
jgi:magnesium transporter